MKIIKLTFPYCYRLGVPADYQISSDIVDAHQSWGCHVENNWLQSTSFGNLWIRCSSRLPI